MITPAGHNLVFLLSTPRAGSTLLSVLLDQFPDVLCPPEPWFLLRLLSLNGSGDPDVAFNDEIATLGTREFLGDRISRNALRAFAVCVYNEKLSAAKKSLFVDKTPRYFHILPEIETVFPQARFIWLQRNPLDVAASYKTTWNLSPGALFQPPARSETLDFVHGLDAFMEFFASLSSNKLVVRYEDLVSHPSAILARLGGFLGVRPTPMQLKGTLSPVTLAKFGAASVGDPEVLRTTGIHSASVERWRSALTPGEVRLVLEHLGQAVFREMGYDSVVEESIAHGWMPPAESTALQRRKALGRTLPQRTAELRSELTKQAGILQQQADYISALSKERDRLTIEAETARSEAQRATTEAQTHIDQLLAQVNHLAATCHQQAAYIGELQQELERISSTEATLRANYAHRGTVIDEETSKITILERQLRKDT